MTQKISLSRRILPRILRPPVFEEDPGKSRQAASLYPILVMSAAAALLYLLISAFQGAVFLGTVGYILPVLAGLLMLQILSYFGQPRIASWMLVVGLALMLVVSTATADGVRSPAYAVFVDVVLIAGALLGTPAAVATGILAAGLGAFLVMAEGFGWATYPRVTQPATVYYFSIQLVILVALAVVWLSSRDIRAALVRASTELEKRLGIQAKLRSRVELGEILASLSAAFVSAGEDAVDELVVFALGELQSFLGADACLLESANGGEMPGEAGRLWSSSSSAAASASGLREALISDPTLGVDAAVGDALALHRPTDDQPSLLFWNAIDPWMASLSSVVVFPVWSVAAKEGLLVVGFGDRTVELEADVLAQIRTLAEIMVNGLNRIQVEKALRESLDELEQAEEAKHDLDYRYQLLFRDSAAAVYISEKDGRILDFNPAAYTMFAIPEWEETAINAADLYAHVEDRLQLQAAMEADGYIQDYPVELKTRDGRLLDCLITATVRRGRDGKVVGYQGIIRDVSQERHRQRQMDLQVRRLESLNRIGQAISGSTDPRVTYEVLLSEVIQLLGVDAASVLVTDAKSGLLVFGAGKGFRTEALRHSQLRFGEGFAGKAALSHQEIFAANLSGTTPFERSPQFAAEGFVSYCGLPLLAKGRVGGVLELFTRFSLEPSDAWWETARSFAAQAAVAMDSSNLFIELERSNLELVRAYDATLEGWAKAHDLRDHETVGHSKRVAEMTVRLASGLRLPGASLVHIYRGALLHDIGKLAIPDAILRKPGKLNEDEWKVMRQHPQLAYELLKGIGYLVPSLDIPRYHHEYWDGNGYPDGLSREGIPLAARIFTVVDVWDALTSDRPYRKAWQLEQVLDYLKERRGTQFDPGVVDVFLEILDGSGDSLSKA